MGAIDLEQRPIIGPSVTTPRLKPPRHKKATTLRAVLANLVRDLRVWWGR